MAKFPEFDEQDVRDWAEIYRARIEASDDSAERILHRLTEGRYFTLFEDLQIKLGEPLDLIQQCGLKVNWLPMGVQALLRVMEKQIERLRTESQ